MMNIQLDFRLSAPYKRAQKEEQRELLEALCLWGMRHASRARMKKRLKYYPTGGANVCVCVSKLFELTKYKVLKDKGKHTFLFTSLTPYI